MGKHEQAAVSRLHALANHCAPPDTGAAGSVAADLLFATDVVSAVREAANLFLHLEAIEEYAQEAKVRLRAALAEVMADNGISGVDLQHHRVSVVDGKASVIITDPAAIPADYMRQPPPQPDKVAIAAALKAGPVPGATLSNPQSHIRFSPKKATAA